VHCLRRTYHRLSNHFGRTRWNSYVTWVMSNLVSVRLETVLMSVQDRCTICAKRTIGSGIVLGMVLLDDEDQVEAHFCLFGDSANLDIRWVHYLRRTYHRLENHFVRTRWNSYVMWVMSNLVLVHLEMVLMSMQDSCTVCAKCRNYFGCTQWFS
jgi:lysine/ornithine N-monooxygenase